MAKGKAGCAATATSTAASSGLSGANVDAASVTELGKNLSAAPKPESHTANLRGAFCVTPDRQFHRADSATTRDSMSPADSLEAGSWRLSFEGLCSPRKTFRKKMLSQGLGPLTPSRFSIRLSMSAGSTNKTQKDKT